ncbi:1,2-dihydroxy-3-keto-5-methylthiopentene dioxygenase 2 [Aphelenchoides avenae]|nr:1,2-dihydroxy-3-keto-5-methylthiopentene dioxygenase 2 [Aphelenchus avenae]
MQAWIMESYPTGDRRMPHHVFPPKMLSQDQLQVMAGVVHYKVDLDDMVAMKKRLSRVKNERKVASNDVMTIDESLMDLETKLDLMYEPVEKTEETVCMVLEGAMYYDVEYEDDKWIRIHMERGDLIVIPKGRYYRCTTTPKNFVKLQRFVKREDGAQG